MLIGESGIENLIDGSTYDCLIMAIRQSPQFESERFYFLEKGELENGSWKFAEFGYASSYQKIFPEMEVYYHRNSPVFLAESMSIKENNANFNLEIIINKIMQILKEEIEDIIYLIDHLRASSIHERAQDVLLLESETLFSSDLRIAGYRNILIKGKAWVDKNNDLQRHTSNRKINISIAIKRLQNIEIGLL